MNDVIGRIFKFEKQVFARHADLYDRLASKGQSPKALMISCADSRIVPELILQAEPGDLFVTRNAGNIVPPFAQANGGVSSAVEYAVIALGVTDIIVCGHSGCGAMEALTRRARSTRCRTSPPGCVTRTRLRASFTTVIRSSSTRTSCAVLALENVVTQIAHLRTHPSVASAIARGKLALHGWFVDIHAGSILALDGEKGQFQPVRDDAPLPVALPHAPRLAAVPLLKKSA